ncbi:hypothetical protein ENBRE01_1903 [Enteropsectra breve]|nr:hypothetical protein ENBRE01_1903 [Enteropsectra breve]
MGVFSTIIVSFFKTASSSSCVSFGERFISSRSSQRPVTIASISSPFLKKNGILLSSILRFSLIFSMRNSFLCVVSLETHESKWVRRERRSVVLGIEMLAAAYRSLIILSRFMLW